MTEEERKKKQNELNSAYSILSDLEEEVVMWKANCENLARELEGE